jgi:hypothetical protein
MELTKYSQIPLGTIFKANGGSYRKADDLYFDDLQTGFQGMWSPMFDATIETPSSNEVKATDDSTKEFITDPQSRIVKRNPDYNPAAFRDKRAEAAVEAFNEMWGSALFDCGPEDYVFMRALSVNAVRFMDKLATAVGESLYSIEGLIKTLADAYMKQKTGGKKKLAAKKTATKVRATKVRGKAPTKKTPIKKAKKK